MSPRGPKARPVNRRAGWLGAALLLAGCVPARWPAQPEAPRAPLPPVASSPHAPAEPAAPAAPSAPSAGNPPFYEVFGERYFVMPNSDGYREKGVASWYGAQFHGKRTSSGAIYNMNELTAAHKTLPLPSLVRVTNLDTGRSVVVTVNDRGPFVKDRLIDLSYAAAQQLGIVQTGTGSVEVEALGGRSGAQPVVKQAVGAAGASAETAQGTGVVAPTMVPVQRLFMQVGAFSDEVNATRLKANLESNGVSNVVIRYDDATSPALYRVRVGPIEGSAEYDAVASRIASLRIANPQLVTETLTKP
jgi:rare lipoprotein A